MSKLGAVFLAVALLWLAPLAVPQARAAEAAPHKIVRDAAWGCRARREVFDLLFLGLSASFDDQLAAALADGRCIYFKPGETVVVIENSSGHGLVQVQRGGEVQATYWTQLRNVD